MNLILKLVSHAEQLARDLQQEAAKPAYDEAGSHTHESVREWLRNVKRNYNALLTLLREPLWISSIDGVERAVSGAPGPLSMRPFFGDISENIESRGSYMKFSDLDVSDPSEFWLAMRCNVLWLAAEVLDRCEKIYEATLPVLTIADDGTAEIGLAGRVIGSFRFPRRESRERIRAIGETAHTGSPLPLFYEDWSRLLKKLPELESGIERRSLRKNEIAVRWVGRFEQGD